MRRPPTILPNLLSGQNDTRVQEGTELPRWILVPNSRLRDGSLSRRPGMRRIAVCGTDATSLDFVAASSHHVVIPAPAHAAMRKPFTLEFLYEPDAYAGTQVLQGFNHATDWPFKVWMDDADLKVTFTDSDGNAESVTTLSMSGTSGEQFAIQVVVAADNSYAWTAHYLLTNGSYNTSTDSGTLATATGAVLKAPAGDMYLGRDNGGNYYDGHLEYTRAYRYAAPNFDWAWRRWPTPQQPYMVFDYGGEIDANDWVQDRSIYGNHGAIQNALGTAASLCVNAAPVQGMRQFLDKNGKQRLLVVAGGRPHSVEL